MESSSRNKGLLYDEIRKIWVSETKEEKVRQNLIKKMITKLSYPRELLSVERSLAELSNHSLKRKIPTRRVDITSFAKNGSTLYPLLVIECKESKELTEGALAQVRGYNYFIKAPFIAVAYPEGELFGYPAKEGFAYLSYIPSYQELILAVQNG
ncbi:MAG: type I restriction enzyme HsdR N-terminal domain-containing protein [Verrucomicrobia bacterium]|nr:type I restriction enzyme HsdR N-terminal domain-containing protein [Verrucomicrobiota bacterium]